MSVPAEADTLLARSCPALADALRLAVWVGEGRPVTAKRVLRPVDVTAAARALRVAVPARVRTATDVLALHRPWQVAVAVGFLRIVDGHARPGPVLAQWRDLDADTVGELWLAGLVASFAAGAPGADETAAAAFARFMLAELAADPRPPAHELWWLARRAFEDDDCEAAYDFLDLWRRRDDGFGGALEPLIGFGAAERPGPGVRITALGRWALHRMRARAPKPITADLAADQVLARLVEVGEDRRWSAAQRWLGERAPLEAARDLLAAAATATPAQRVAAVTLVGYLDEPAQMVWDAVAEVPNLAAHARSMTDKDPGPQDEDWLAVEFAAAALAVDGPDEALSVLDDVHPVAGFDEQVCALGSSAHPDAAELAASLTEFLASGATPSAARAYQLNISLDRMRSPVWRRVLLPATTDLETLHRVIQIVMDWDGDHLHAFTVGRKRYGDPFNTPEAGAEDALRCNVVFTGRERIAYQYDFGAGWNHTITLERVLDRAGATHPVCVAGRGDAPVEDCADGQDTTPYDQDVINGRLAELGPDR